MMLPKIKRSREKLLLYAVVCFYHRHVGFGAQQLDLLTKVAKLHGFYGFVEFKLLISLAHLVASPEALDCAHRLQKLVIY